MTIGIAITTAPRPRVTLGRSLLSMRHAGFDDCVYVMADGPVDEELRGITVVINNDPPLGGLRNWIAALEMLIACTTDEWLMIVEDDVLWARGSCDALMRDLRQLAKVADVGYLSLYLANKVADEISRRKGTQTLHRGMYTTNLGEKCWGSQAYVIPRAVAKRLLANDRFDEYRRTYVKNRNRDNIVSGCLHAMGLRLFYRVPCLVSHELGSANSSLADKPVQRALLTRYWTGYA